MDEPTAALDARAEHRIFAGLRELAEDRAVLLITQTRAGHTPAHRPERQRHMEPFPS